MKKNVKETESMSSVIMNGVAYELTNEPSHGVVRGVKKMQKEISIGLIKNHRKKFTSDTSVENALQQIFDEDPSEVANFTDANEEFVIIGTISLATNTLWTTDMLGAVPEKEVMAAFEKCKTVLGGEVTTFL
jgi:hypothetical protein